MDWPEAQTMVLQGNADALMPMNPTAERRKIYDFSEPFLESYFSIYAHSRVTGISGMSSLRGLRVGVVPGGLPRVLLSKDPRIHLVTVRDYPDGFSRLGKSEIDAVVADYRVGPYVLAQSGIRNVKVTGEPIQWVHSTIAVKKGNTQLLGEINHALQTIKVTSQAPSRSTACRCWRCGVGRA
jgi:ABC-type amino acid transport substrate-binding protein